MLVVIGQKMRTKINDDNCPGMKLVAAVNIFMC